MCCSPGKMACLAAVLIPLMAWASARADEADDQYAVAAGHYTRQQWEFAAEEFETFLARYPQHPKFDDGVFFLAETLVQLDRYDQARARFHQYLDRAPEGEHAKSALFRSGEVDYLTGNYTPARRTLDQFASRYPDDPLNAYVLAYLGDIALSGGDPAEAEEHYRLVLARFPQAKLQDDCRFGLARALEKLGRPDEAGRLLLALGSKKATPLSDDARFRLGALEYEAGRFDEAVATFEAFESDFPESPWLPTVRLARGWALWKLDRLEEAADLFGRVASDPKVGVEARYWLGLAEKAREDWQAAAATFLAAVEAEPRHALVPALRFQAGDALLRAGDVAAARSQFERIVSEAPEDNEWIDDALCGAVQAALAQKDHAAVDRHAATFDRRFLDSPLAGDVKRILARSLLDRKEYARAEALLKPMLADDAGKPSAEDEYLYSLACQGLGRHDDALAALSAVSDSAAGQVRADAQLAEASVLVGLNRFGEAIKPLTAFLADDPQGDQALKARAQLAVCYARSGRLAEAKEEHGRLLDAHPSEEVLVPAVEQLADAAYEAGDLPWASQLFAWLIDEAPPGASKQRGLSGLAWCQYKTGRPEEAAATFNRLLKSDPDGSKAAEAAMARGRILQELDRPDAALAMYDRVLDRHAKSPLRAEAAWAAARLCDELDRDQQTASLCEKLAAEFPDFAQIDTVLYTWAWALNDVGRADEAYALFDRIRREHPESDYWADATFRLAQHAFKSGDNAQAQQLVELALAKKPHCSVRANFLYLSGQILAADEKWAKARQAFDTLVADYPQSPLRRMAEYGAAESVFRQANYAAAGQLLEDLAKKTEGRDDPWLAMAQLRLAQSLAYEKKWTEAYAVASTIEGRFPDFSQQYEADYVIGRCLASRADFEGAREAYRRAIRSPAGSKTDTAAKAQLMIAESHFHQKDYRAALREYLRLEILYAYPELQAAALLQAAKCHELLGEKQQAAQTYRRLVKSYADTTFAGEAARRLEAADPQAAPTPSP